MSSSASGRAPRRHVEVERELNVAVRAGLMTGAVCLMEQAGRPAHFAVAGLKQASPRRPMTFDALFELGALSQSLGLAPYVAWLVGHNRLDLDAKLRVCLPELKDTGFAHVPVGALLEHQAGLGSRTELWAALEDQGTQAPLAPRSGGGPAAPQAPALFERQSLMPLIARALAEARPDYVPLTECRYTPLSALLMGLAVETLGHKSLATLAEAALWRPLGLANVLMPSAPAHSFVRVQQERLLSGAEAACRVARASGGLAGHAGLKASATGVMVILNALRSAYVGDRQARLFQSAAVRRMWTRSPRVADAPWAVGWQSLGRGGPLGQGRWHPSSVGQVSLEEGCAYFVDPHHNLCCVLLTHGIRKAAAVRPGAGAETPAASPESRTLTFKQLTSYCFERALSLH